ncbi:lycopene cyclase domain-containing protein [Halopenitus salinus]|uniref:Lycopene cyclase domain-containing protein n=1 Tax=Halopenitus salinus TaxID=1198295 RepID=A0ABD5URI7_9EURY
MIPPLTYFEFHALFLAPPILALVAVSWRRSRLDRRLLEATAILSIAAVAYTTPWDAWLIEAGVWWYGEGVVAGRILGVPLGEYAFFLLQPVLTLAWTAQFQLSAVGSPSMSPWDRLVGALAGIFVGAVGWTLLGGSSPLEGSAWLDGSAAYLGAVLLWAGPVLAVQWAYDWRALVRRRRTLALGVCVPTLYLCLADRIAIGLGLWRISSDHTTGITPLGLPIEEGAFFLATNVFLVQGLLAYVRLVESGTGTAAGNGTATTERGGDR